MSDFNFFIPVEIVKAKDDKGKMRMRMRGVASTGDVDDDGETLEASGFDLDMFKKSGFVNWHHQSAKDPLAIIGEPIPDGTLIKNNEFHIEADLYPESEMAQKAYKLQEILEKSGSKRRLGWSIEGKALERDSVNPKRVKKARITGVALTMSPKNANTFANIVKGNVESEFVNIEHELENDCIVDAKDDVTRLVLTKAYDIEMFDADELNKADENDLEKAGKGEGSKGGKIIGHTKSGKPIYDSASHEGHKDFTSQEHKEASKLHQSNADVLRKKIVDEDSDESFSKKMDEWKAIKDNQYKHETLAKDKVEKAVTAAGAVDNGLSKESLEGVNEDEKAEAKKKRLKILAEKLNKSEDEVEKAMETIKLAYIEGQISDEKMVELAKSFDPDLMKIEK